MDIDKITTKNTNSRDGISQKRSSKYYTVIHQIKNIVKGLEKN
jgi:hypothetical protein